MKASELGYPDGSCREIYQHGSSMRVCVRAENHLGGHSPRDRERFPAMTSACISGMHACCDDVTCGCGVCHNVCNRCGEDCRVTYTDDSLCADCYKSDIRKQSQSRMAYGLREDLTQRPVTDI